MAHLLLIGGHEETFRMIEELPVKWSVFQDAAGVTEYQAQHAHQLCVFDYRDLDEALRRAQALHASKPLDGVVSFTEYGLMPAAVIKEALGIKGNALEAVRLTRDKVAMREHLASLDLATVRFRRCASAAEVKDFLAIIDAPVIVKPATGSGSSGVFRVAGIDQIDTAFACSRGEFHGSTIVEEYIDGPEYSVESFTVDGRHDIIAVTEKITTGAPRYVEIGHCMPATAASEDFAEFRNLVTAFLDAIGHTFGPAHTEVRRGPTGLRIIEGNTRPGGDFIWELVLHAMGHDLVRDTVCHLGGLSPRSRPPGRGAGRVAFFAYQNVMIEAVQGIEAARQVDGVVRLHCTLESGQCLGPLKSSDDRQGVIVVVGSDPADAQRRLKEAQDRIHVEISPISQSLINAPFVGASSLGG